jgi:hypothetical protein
VPTSLSLFVRITPFYFVNLFLNGHSNSKRGFKQLPFKDLASIDSRAGSLGCLMSLEVEETPALVIGSDTLGTKEFHSCDIAK